MHRRISGSAPLAALTVLLALVLAAPAHANQWYVQNGPREHRARLAHGESVEVPTSGTIMLKTKLATVRGTQMITCEVAGSELLSNPTGKEAIAQTMAMSFECNNEATVTPEMLPWTGELGGSCQPCSMTRPEAVDLQIGGVDYGEFTGAITGRIGDFDDPIHDDIDNDWKWQGTQGGLLTNEEGSTIAFGGDETYGTKSERNRACGEPNVAAVEEESRPETSAQHAAERRAEALADLVEGITPPKGGDKDDA